MTFGSLFSGIGGFDIGFEWSGMDCRWQVEIDNAASGVLARHWPHVRRYRDVRECGAGNLEPVDVICGGFPCQDVSVAGRRAGLAKERSGLWYEFHRILAEVKPEWVVIENVPGLLSSNGGRDFATILRGLADIGYLSAWRVLDAQHFGVAQRRRRVFIVGCLTDGRAAQVLFEREGSGGDIAPSREAGAGVARSLTGSTGGASAKEQQYTFVSGNGRPLNALPDLADTLRSASDRPGAHGKVNGTDRMTLVPDVATAIVQRIGKGGFTDPVNDNVIAYGIYDEQTPKVGEDVMPSLRSRQTGGGSMQCVAFEPRYFTRDNKTGGAPGDTTGITNAHKAGDSAPVIAFDWQQSGSAGDITATLNVTRIQAVSLNAAVRRLTPTECERLQGFPDGWTDGQSDSQRYRQLGNAVCVNVAEWIGRRLVGAIAPERL